MNTEQQLAKIQALKKGDPITVAGFHGMSYCHRVIFDSMAGSTIYYKENARKRTVSRVVLDYKNLICLGHMYSPFVDADTNQCMINCQFNLIGDNPEHIKTAIQANNLNPNFDSYERMYYRSAKEDAEKVQPLYPDGKPA